MLAGACTAAFGEDKTIVTILHRVESRIGGEGHGSSGCGDGRTIRHRHKSSKEVSMIVNNDVVIVVL